VTIRELGKLEQDENSKIIIKYDVYFGGTIIFTIHSGFTSTVDGLTGGVEGLYYIRIRFAGLKSHIQRNDEASFNVLMTICAFLNTTRTKYRMVELDVAIDAYCSLDNILAICVKKSGKTIYNEIAKILSKLQYASIATSSSTILYFVLVVFKNAQIVIKTLKDASSFLCIWLFSPANLIRI
jgi:hypothetical protein